MSAAVESLHDFPNEKLAEDYVAACLKPFCTEIARQFRLPSGLKPDLMIRLRALPEIRIAVEVKSFAGKPASTLCDAVGQASSYAAELGTAAFIAPLRGKGAMAFDWQRNSVGAMLLMAAQFGVGGLYFANARTGGMLLGGAQVAFFSHDDWGDPNTRLHSHAEHLLKLKRREGSKSWR